MTDTEIKEKLLTIIENNPTDWPWLMAGILGDTSLPKETTQRMAQLLDEISQFQTVEDAKQALLRQKH